MYDRDEFPAEFDATADREESATVLGFPDHDRTGEADRTGRTTDTGPEDGIAPEDWTVNLDDERDDNTIEGTVVELPVDPADAPKPDFHAALDERLKGLRPVVPVWMRDRDEARYVARWAARYSAHTGAYHLARTPKYSAKLLTRVPRGAGRITVGTARWLFDREAAPLRTEAVRRGDVETYLKLARMRNDRVRSRLAMAMLAGIGGTVLVTIVLVLAPEAVRWMLAGALLAGLGLAGGPADRPLLDVARIKPRARKLTADVVTRALLATGLVKDAADISFPAPIMRDGPGWRATVDLPHGVTSGKVIARRDQLASGLDLPLGQVWPEPVPGGSLRRLVLWVGDEDLSQSPPALWPLIKRGKVDLFATFPFGRTQRGTEVPMSLMFTNLLVGSVPRMGKTFALRLVLLAAGLDPTAELHVYDLKGGQDFMAFEQIAHRFAVGNEAPAIDYALTDLRELRKRMQDRYRTLRDLPADICPESKVTRELADKRSLDLFPIVVAADECQVWFTHKEHGEEFAEIVTDLIKRGPAVGIIIALATQKPDGDSIPSGIRDNVGTRFGMRVMTWQVSDMVLGSGMAKSGTNAAALTRADKGIGYLVGASDDVDSQLARADLCDSEHTALVVVRARALREAADLITGHAAGHAPVVDEPTVSLLDDLLAVLPATETRVWSETVTARLAELRPEIYGGWKPSQLAAALKPYGVTTVQVWRTGDDGQGANKRGIVRDDIAAAARARRQQAS
ncbi:MAG: cell division protein FtsK [Streptosporangiales bacterium]|nr:cell division protein FtsK [Streptosporangiales bacterium]